MPSQSIVFVACLQRRGGQEDPDQGARGVAAGQGPGDRAPQGAEL